MGPDPHASCLRGARAAGPRAIPFAAAAGAVVLFVLAVAPWYARQLAVFGSLSPSTASGRVLYIRDIAEWNSITIPATLDHLLGMGIGPLLLTRIGGLVAAAFIFSILVGVLLFIPFMVVGAWRRRHDAAFGPYLGFAVLLFAFSALVSAVHVPGGTFIHSAVALAPHGYVLALEGIVLATAAMAARRKRWDATSAARVFIGGAVAFGVITSVAGAIAVHNNWGGRRERMQAVSVALDGAGAPVSDRVMSIDAAGYRYWTGHPGVVLVNDPLDTVEQVARAYGIRWLVLEPDDSVEAAREILVNDNRPGWVGPPILDRDDVAVYPVCLEAGDPRCQSASAGGVG